MEKARFNPRYAGVHIWLRKDKDLKTSFKRRVNDEIYDIFSWMYETNAKTAYSEPNLMWLDWFGGNGQATGSFGPNTQPPEYVANQLPSNVNATYGGHWWQWDSDNVAWLYTRLSWWEGKCWYGFGWVWTNRWQSPSLSNTPHNIYDKGLRFFKNAATDRGGLGPASYALWYVNGRPSTDLYDLFYNQFSDETKNCVMTETHENWAGFK